MSWYLYKLIPPRPDFATTLTEHEAGIMREHSVYWREHMAAGRVMIFSPVADPAGDWGMGVIRADSLEDAHLLGADDPAVSSGMARHELFELPGAVVPD